MSTIKNSKQTSTPGFALHVLKKYLSLLQQLKILRTSYQIFFPKSQSLKKLIKKKFHLAKSKKLNHVLNETENNISCDYFEINEFKEIKIKQHDFLLLHLNISSLSSQINELVTFLDLFQIKFEIICITESRLSQKTSHQQHQYPWT